MAAILTLDDGRHLYGPTIGIGGMLSLIADSVSPEEAKLARWLEDVSNRCAPFLDFDTRGLSDSHRAEFWRSAKRAFAKLLEKFGPDMLSRENAFAANCLDRLLKMGRSIEKGEPPESLNDLEIARPHDGEAIDLDDLWQEAKSPSANR